MRETHSYSYRLAQGTRTYCLDNMAIGNKGEANTKLGRSRIGSSPGTVIHKRNIHIQCSGFSSNTVPIRQTQQDTGFARIASLCLAHIGHDALSLGKAKAEGTAASSLFLGSEGILASHQIVAVSCTTPTPVKVIVSVRIISVADKGMPLVLDSMASVEYRTTRIQLIQKHLLPLRICKEYTRIILHCLRIAEIRNHCKRNQYAVSTRRTCAISHLDADTTVLHQKGYCISSRSCCVRCILVQHVVPAIGMLVEISRNGLSGCAVRICLGISTRHRPLMEIHNLRHRSCDTSSRRLARAIGRTIIIIWCSLVPQGLNKRRHRIMRY